MNNIIKNIAVIMTVIAVFVTTGILSRSLSEEAEAADSFARTSVSGVTTVSNSTTTKKQTFKPYSRYIKHNKTAVRNKPNKEAKIVKRLSLGKKVKITAKRGNWRKIGKNKWVHKKHLAKKDPTPKFQGIKLKYSAKYNITDNKLTRGKGVVYYNGHKETWYSSKEYGQTQTAYHIPGKHLADDGTYRDKDGYICIAANYLSKGATIMTSLGPGKVYDRGGMTGKWIDIYTNWS